MIADQDQTKEKISEGGNFEKPKETLDFESKKTEGGVERENNLENLSSPENDQEKKKEALEAIRQKSGSGKDDDDDNADDEHATIHVHAKDISEIKDFDQKVDKIVQLAIQKDPFTAMKVARHLDDNYVVDQVRDRLVEDETRKILIERGLLKEI